jgi:hypothetical protein
MRRLPTPALVTGITAFLLTFALVPTRIHADAIQPMPPDGTAYGMKLSDWAVAWVQWNLSIPKSANPGLDLDPNNHWSGVGQHAPVWFVPFTAPGTVANRTFTLPDGQAVLLAVASGFAISAPGAETEEQQLADVRVDVFDHLTKLEVKLDGTPIPNLAQYRLQTPVVGVTFPPGNVAGWTLGTDHRIIAAADGYFFLFPPLPLGKHVLEYQVAAPYPDGKSYTTQLTLNLLVLKPNDPLP